MGQDSHELTHRAVVDAWIEQAIDDANPAEIVELFRAAAEALWNCAVTTLGSVTLIAIADRVLSTVTRRYSFLSAINVRPNGDARWKQHLRERLVQVPRQELVDGLRFAFTEFLIVIGRLTAEILSPALHAAILEVRASQIGADARTAQPAEPSRAATKELS